MLHAKTEVKMNKLHGKMALASMFAFLILSVMYLLDIAQADLNSIALYALLANIGILSMTD